MARGYSPWGPDAVMGTVMSLYDPVWKNHTQAWKWFSHVSIFGWELFNGIWKVFERVRCRTKYGIHSNPSKKRDVKSTLLQTAAYSVLTEMNIEPRRSYKEKKTLYLPRKYRTSPSQIKIEKVTPQTTKNSIHSKEKQKVSLSYKPWFRSSARITDS